MKKPSGNLSRMRARNYRRAQMLKRTQWAKMLIGQHTDVSSQRGKRLVGRLAVHHQVCGCFYCRYPKQFDVPTLALKRSDDSDRDSAIDLESGLM